MWLSRPAQRHPEPLSRIGAVAVFAVEGAKPTQVVCQVAGGNAAILKDPAFESAVIRINVLHMQSPIDANTRRQIDGMMLDTELACCTRQGRTGEYPSGG
jgi:hypothetical protein